MTRLLSLLATLALSLSAMGAAPYVALPPSGVFLNTGAGFINPGPSPVSPVISSPTSPTVGGTTATICAVTNTFSGTVYGVVDTTAHITGITAGQIEVGQNNTSSAAVAAGSASVTSSPACTSVSGLTASTTYGYALVQTNSTNTSNVLSSGTFTTSSSGGGATLVFNYPSGFASAGGAITKAGDTSLVGSVYQLVPTGAGHNHGAIWYTAQQNVSSGFTTQFTFQFTPAPTPVPIIAGITFVVQNVQNTGQQFGNYGLGLNGDANCAGYGSYNPADYGSQAPPINSIGVKFDINNLDQNSYQLSAGSPNGTGLYINGGPYNGLLPYNDLAPYGIDLYNGDVFQGNIVYDGSLLTLVLLDTTTGAQARQVWPVNIPFATSSNTNWVGFGGGAVTLPGAAQINSWTYWSGYNTRLTTPTFSVAPGQYASTQTVSISAPAGSTVYYTTNGLLPTSASTQYTSALTVSANETIQAVAIQSGFTDSLVAVGAYQIGTANLVNFPSGFAANDGVVLVGNTYLTGSQIQLTDTNSAGLEAGAAWFATPVNVQSFTTVFTIKETSASANGMTFTIQNTQPVYISNNVTPAWSGGPGVVGGSQQALGYGAHPSTGQSTGIRNSVALAFDLYTVANSVGLYTNGAMPTGSQNSITGGLNIASGHPIQVTLTYNGTTLAMSMLDTVNSDTFSYNWTVNIPSVVGANTAYVGFTGSTGGLYANQFINSWTYHN